MTTPADTSADNPSASEIGYADALAELDEILGQLDDDRIDIDVLSERVQRAAYLISVCRSRISAAQERVANVVAELESAPTHDTNSDTDA